MILCVYWQDCSMPGGGCCALGLFRGKVRYDICNKICTKRVDGEPGSPIPAPPARPKGGPGTELKKLIAKIERARARLGKWLERWSFAIGGGCNCEAHAARMDQWGPDKCEQEIETIVGWLRTETEKRKMSFSKSPARMLIRRAIHNSRSCELPAIHK